MRAADRTEYIVTCIREAGSMYPQDAEAFLAEHDAHRRAEMLRDLLERLEQAAGESAVEQLLAHNPELADAGKDTREGESTRAAVGTCGRALSTGQPCPDHPLVPRTERSYWVAIADALNTAGAAGIAVGIDIEGILTDHLAWAVVWNRETERWEVGGYEDDSPAETPASAEDWVICCSPSPRCPNGERRARAVERGWTQEGRAGNWLCAEHSPDFFQPGHTYTDSQVPQFGWAFRCDTVTWHPVDRERTALGWRRVLSGEWEPYAYGEQDWDPEHFTGVASTAPGGESRG